MDTYETNDKQNEAADLADGLHRCMDALEKLSLPGHQCETIADFSDYMAEGRTWRLGRLTEPIESYEHEVFCFHITTPEKPEVVFGFNEPDMQYLAAVAYAALGYHTSSKWIEHIARAAKNRTESHE